MAATGSTTSATSRPQARSARLLSMRPLQGIRVIEAASYISGPFAGLTLADLGADVIKVEPPTGDPYRRFGPQDADGGVIFRAGNRNKRSVALDLTTDVGLAELHTLLDTADVLITNWRPGVAEAFGLTAEARARALAAARVGARVRLRPDRADGHAAGVRLDHPGARRLRGLATPTTRRWCRRYVADKVTATFAAQSALAAIVQRGATGARVRGRHRHARRPRLLRRARPVRRPPGARSGRRTRAAHAAGAAPAADGRRLDRAGPGERTADQAGDDRRRLGRLARRDAVAARPDRRLRERFFELFGDHLRSRTTAEWTAIFAEADVPCSAVMSTAEHLDDEQVVHNRMYRIVPDPTLGQVRRRASPGAVRRRTGRHRRSAVPAAQLGRRRVSAHVRPRSTSISRGSPSTCSATMLRCTANVPPPTVSAGAKR